jgi:acetyl-CoA C-acetyltransferase
MNDVLVVGAARLPIGRFGGTLKEVSDWDLGAIAITEAIKRAGLRGNEIDEVIMAHGFRTGDLPANSSRAVAIKAGIPIETPQFTINKACGGSLRAISLAAQIIKAGESDVIVAGGMESMSRAAFLLTKARWGYRLGHGQLIDPLVLFDPISGYSLGETGENVAELYRISRDDQDRFAFLSQQKAEIAIKSNKFKEEIVPVPVPQIKGAPLIFNGDEHPRFGTKLEAL